MDLIGLTPAQLSGLERTALRQQVFALTDAATIAIDAGSADNYVVTLGGNRTLGAMTGAWPGKRMHLTVIQDGTGGRTLTTVTNYPKLTWADTGNTAGKRSTIAAVFDGTNWNQDGAQTPYI